MRSRLVLTAVLAVAVLAPACTVGGAEPAAGGVLDQLHIAPPEPVRWQRTIAGVDVVGTEGRADPAELELMAGAFAEVPQPILDAVGLRYVVRSANLGTNVDLHPATTAFARGPDIYFLDRTFVEPRAGATRLGLARVLVHELAHIAQFDTLDEDHVAAVLDGRLEISDTESGSTLVAEFAAEAGWRNTSSDPLRPAWSLESPASGTTEYGASSPDEDMAESLAMVAVGRSELISPARVRFIEQWLGVRAAGLSAGKPWAPAGSREAFFRDPVYDEDAVAAFGAAHAEPLYFELPLNVAPAARLAQSASSELRRRGLTGALEPVADDRLPRFAGSFARRDGVRFWVELWDFRETNAFASAPAGPVLSYVMLW